MSGVLHNFLKTTCLMFCILISSCIQKTEDSHTNNKTSLDKGKYLSQYTHWIAGQYIDGKLTGNKWDKQLEMIKATSELAETVNNGKSMTKDKANRINFWAKQVEGLNLKRGEK